MKSKFLQSLAVAAVLVSGLSGTAQAAGSASLSLTPNSGSYVKNSSFTVQVHENGDNVNVVTAKLTYDATKLTCNGVGASSAFANTIDASCANGNVTISRYVAPGTTVSGDQVVGSINFTVLGDNGSTNVNFAAGSQIASNGNNVWNGNTTGGSYTLTAPVVTPPTNPTPTTPSTGGSTSNTGNTNKTTTTKKTTPATSNTTAVAGEETVQTPATTTATTDKPKADKKPEAKIEQKTVASQSTAKKGLTILAWILAAVAVLGGLYLASRSNSESDKPTAKIVKNKRA